jgi:DNA-binding beta-propeller fold protein YncE
VKATAASAAVLCLAALLAQPAGTQIPLDNFPLSTALSRDGKTLLVMHAGNTPSISVIDTTSLKERARVPVADAWHGMTFSPDGRTVYAGGGSRRAVLEFSLSAGGNLTLVRELGSTAGSPLAASVFIGDVAVSPDGRLLYAADLLGDAIVVINPQSGRAIERFKTGRRPYRILFPPEGKSFFVTSWAEGAVYQHETANGNEIGRIRLAPQTMDMVLSDRKVPEDESGSRVRLFVTAAGSNNVFVVGMNAANELKTLEVLNVGMVPAQPAGMTPSALALNPDQTTLYVACSDANVIAAVDISESRSRVTGFIPAGAYPTAARILPEGKLAVLNGHSNSLSVIDATTSETLAAHTRKAQELAPYRPTMAGAQPAARSLFENVIYILTDTPPPAGSRNYEKLKREFVRFGNYKAAGVTSLAANFWAVAGIAPAFTARLAPAQAAGRLRMSNFMGEFANLPPAGYLWSNARSAGLTVRNYGEFVDNGRVADPSLASITNLSFKGADAERARIFLDELKQFDSAGTMPKLIVMRLAGEDAAIGSIVEGVSKARFWPKTAIFLTGADLLAMSPYTRRGIVDNTAYDQTSVLRTIELILGLRPMTMFDASARPLTAAFGNTPDLTPYTPEIPRP